jgi:transcriptional regulator with GAF, ATPase, and Fis domain/tetratricopeptide (TPR) repeat protein
LKTARVREKNGKDIRNSWRDLNDTEKELTLHLTYLPAPVSIDTLVSISGATIVAVLNALERLRSMGVVAEEKGHSKGFYRLSHPDYTSLMISDPASRDETRRAAEKILEFYDRSTSGINSNEVLTLAELYTIAGAPHKGLLVIKKAADLLSRTGHAEKAVQYYSLCVEHTPAENLTPATIDDFLDCVLGKVSLLIYHMSAQDELLLLQTARIAAIRFKKWDRLARIDMVLAQILQMLGEHKKARARFSSFLKLIEKAGDHRMVKSTILSTCEFLYWKGGLSEVVSYYEKTVGSLEEFGDDVPSLKAAALVGYCFVVCGRVARGMGMIEAVRAKGGLLGFEQVTIFADQMTVLSLIEIRRTSEAEPYLDRLSAHPENALGHLISRGVNDERAYVLCMKGKYREAFEHHQRGVQNALSLGLKHRPGPWSFEYLDILESKGFVDEEVNYDSEVRRLVEWPDVFMKGVAFRYRALRNIERNRSPKTILSDLRQSEKCLEKAGAEVELARTRIALGRYFLTKERKLAAPYLEMAWRVLSRIDKNLFPRDLLETLPEGQKTEAVLERIAGINESLGSIRDKTLFVERVIDVAIDAVMATRGSFAAPASNGVFEVIASRNIDFSVFEKEKIKAVVDIVTSAAHKDREIVFPPSQDDESVHDPDVRQNEEVFQKAGIRSFVGMPASTGGRVHGYLCLDNRLGNTPFRQNHLSFIRFLCSQIAVGLSNIETYEEMRELKGRFEEEAIFYKREMGVAVPIDTIIGKSEGIRKVVATIRQVAPTDSSVLVTGETGVGKELVAKAIHSLSGRKDGAFIPVNLATIPQELVASELFGHEKGAFTGAGERQKGRFELADGGTIFLDEIGDLSAAAQVKLLRVLQEGTFERLGNAQPIRSDFRVIAATNKDLHEEVEKGAFRQDLYYRLSVVPIHVPSLRERKEDIPELARHFTERLCKKLGRQGARIPREEMKKLVDRPWLGNVRELEHTIEQALILSNSNDLAFPDPVRWQSGGVLTHACSELMTLEAMERDYISKILDMTHWRVTGRGGAAAILGMKPTTLFSRMKKLGLERSPRELTPESA